MRATRRPRRPLPGYVPVGDYAATVAEEVEWLVSAARSRGGLRVDEEFFAALFDYAAEDRYLFRRTRASSSRTD